MDIDFSSEIKDFQGDPVIHKEVVTKDGTKRETLTLYLVAVEGLLSALPPRVMSNGSAIPAEESADSKLRKFDLAQRIRRAVDENCGVLSLKPEEVSIVRECINRRWNTLVVGQAYEMTEGKKKEEAGQNGSTRTKRKTTVRT